MKKISIGLIALILVGCSEFSAPNYSKNSTEESSISTSINSSEGREIIGGVVVDVIDGNQFRVQIKEDALINGIGLSKGEVIVVRMLLSQAPENSSKLPFGQEAYAFLYDLIMGKPVELEFEPGLTMDSMGNYLAFTYVEDYRVQDLLIQNGFAKVASYEVPTAYEKEFKRLEQLAKTNTSGIWSMPSYANLEEGFNPLILESNDFTKEKLQELEQELTSSGNDIIKNLFK